MSYLRQVPRRCFSSSVSDPKRKCDALRLGLVPYETAWDWQKQLIERKIRHPDMQNDVVLMLQHPSIYTLGRGASLDNVKFDSKNESSPHQLLKVDRGGEVTYHGPGQLVAYPIFDLRQHKKDLHWYLRMVEEVVIETVSTFGVKAERCEGLTGVWVGDRKIAAIGTHASKWVTMHGFGLNVTTDLSAFENIVPCGIENRGVTSLEHFVPGVSLEEVEEQAAAAFARVFDMNVEISTVSSPLPH